MKRLLQMSDGERGNPIERFVFCLFALAARERILRARELHGEGGGRLCGPAATFSLCRSVWLLFSSRTRRAETLADRRRRRRRRIAAKPTGMMSSMCLAARSACSLCLPLLPPHSLDARALSPMALASHRCRRRLAKARQLAV